MYAFFFLYIFESLSNVIHIVEHSLCQYLFDAKFIHICSSFRSFNYRIFFLYRKKKQQDNSLAIVCYISGE